MEIAGKTGQPASALLSLLGLGRAAASVLVSAAAVVAAVAGFGAAYAGAAGADQSIQSIFDEACDLYESGDFASAQASLEEITAAGVRNAVVYYNLGNCFYKQGLVGKAVANYRRALMLSPRDRDAKANLDLMRASVGSGDTTATYGLASAAALPARLASPRQMQVLFYIAYYLAAAFFLGVLFLNEGLRRTAVYGLVISVAVAAGSFGLSSYSISKFNSMNHAVVVADRAELKSGPGPAFDAISTLPDGLELRQRARSGIWVEVQLPTGEIGWVREKDIDAI